MAERKKPLDQKKTSGQSSQKLPNKNIIRKIIIAAAIFVLLVGITGITIGLIYISDAPEINRAALETVQTSYLYDKNNREVAALHGAENRILVPLEGIPDHVQKAFIAIEDERFEKHFGWDIIGFIRAAVVNLRTRSFTQGASTITQQLVQNAFLTTEKTIKRKTQEIWLAIKFERQYSKEEILEMYLNRIYFGNGAYGVEAAAQMYFNKSVGELELHEAAYLAAIVRSPEYYNPFANEEAGIARTKLVLGNMKRLKFISEAEYEQALSAEFVYGEPPTFAYPHPYYVDYVVHHELVNILSELPEYGSREEAYKAIYTGGLKVYTTLDTDIQAHVETVLNNHDLYPRTLFINMDKLQEAINANNGRLPADYPDAYIDEEKGKPQPQSALVLTDPKTGAIWALGGGRNYAKNQNEDLRFLSKRQPGSAIKPVITYAPAIEEGLLGAGSALDDAPLIGPGGWFPENYDGNFRGMVTVRRALAYSYNLPAVRAYQALGLEKGAEYARKMGISTFEPSDALPSWTLGSREVTALDMAQAFSVFANNGIRVDLHAVQRIEDSNGQIIYEHKANPQQVLSPQTTFIINDILQDVVRYTTATGLQSPRPMAAKTGTTDDARDIYLCAYAPNIVASFWMGYDINLMGTIPNGWNYTTAVLRQVFSKVFETLPVEQFPPAPSGVVRREVCSKSGLLPSDECREAETVVSDYFLADHVPRMPCNMHVTLEICEVSGDLANEFCPEDQIKKKSFFDRPDFITTDGRWPKGAGRKPADVEEKPPTEKCSVHTEFSGGITSFTAMERNNDILLEWEHSGPRVEEYHLYRQTEGETDLELLVSLPGNQRRYSDKDVQPGKTYVYCIYAVYEHGHSEAAIARVTFKEEKPPQPPPRPLTFNAEQSGNNIKLSWKYLHEAIIDGFIITRFVNGIESTPPIVINDRTSREYVDEDLAPGEYTYTIVAVKDGITSEVTGPTKKITIAGEETGPEGTGSFFWSLISRDLPQRLASWFF